ncbi:hypothetical protein [Streptomyces sp. CC208A]|uniref:hypothetical protein n=1 Tax=Streptomyces sp. CC208A TaxID=3044573 RepID=UPI0024A94DD4|nr:hypothetical protein [Streptomyces sp. CC208A]
MAVALGAGTALGPASADALGVGGLLARLIPAALVTALAVPLVLRFASPGSLGFGSATRSGRAFLTGVGVTATAAALVLDAGTAGGMLHWGRFDLASFAGFLSYAEAETLPCATVTAWNALTGDGRGIRRGRRPPKGRTGGWSPPGSRRRRRQG